jgi:hypothetical protein
MTEQTISALEMDIRAVDAQYKGFPSFAEWSKLAIDTVKWDRYSEQ